MLPLRYAPMDLISTSLALLGQPVNNPQALDNPAVLSKLRSLLKGIRVRQKTAGRTGRIRSIKELKGAAGNHTFTLNDGTDITPLTNEYSVPCIEDAVVCEVDTTAHNVTGYRHI